MNDYANKSGYKKTINVVNYTGNGMKKRAPGPPPAKPPPKRPDKVNDTPSSESGSGSAGVLVKVIPTRTTPPDACLWPEFKDGAIPFGQLKDGAMVDGIRHKAPPLTPEKRVEEMMSPAQKGLMVSSEYVRQPIRSEMIWEYAYSRANSSKLLAEERMKYYEQDKKCIMQKIIFFVTKFYANVSPEKRVKDLRWSWIEIVAEIKMIMIKMLARSKDVRMMGNGIASQYGKLTAHQMMDESLVYYSMANLDKMLDLREAMYAMMALSMSTLTPREYDDLVLMFVANPEIQRDRMQWHNHWGLPDPNDQDEKDKFWKYVISGVETIEHTNGLPQF